MSITLDIQQPQPFDLVGADILIAGNATAFEGTLGVTVSEGHDEYSGFVTVGALGLRQFQGVFSVPASHSFQLSRVFLTLADDSGNENGPSVVIPLLFGPKILAGYAGWQPHVVRAGDTLTKIAQQHYGTNDFQPIFEANQHVLSNPNLIFPGQVLRVPRADI